MRVVRRKKALPKDWTGLPTGNLIVFQDDIKLTPSSSLVLKLLVFKTIGDMRTFWIKALGKHPCEIGFKCRGIVTALGLQHQEFNINKPNTKPWMSVDPRYFAVMGLIQDHLVSEILTHESVHAAFCYCKRVDKRNLFFEEGDFHEEELAYPAGRIACCVNHSLYKSGLYKSVGISHKDGTVCQQCGAGYKVDLIVEDSLWKKIRPNKKKPVEAGLLCGRCIMNEIEKIGDFGSFNLMDNL